MNILILLLALVLLVGGEGFYFGGSLIGGLGLILLICLALFLTGNLGRR
jgi:hypothetical protein